MTYLVIDGILLAALALSAFLGYRRGLILTLCGFLALFVAFFGATAVSNTMAGPLSRTIQPALESNIQRFLDDQMAPAPEDTAPAPFGDSQQEETHADIPLQDALELLKGNRVYQGFAEAFQDMVDSGMAAVTANAARAVSDYIASQVARTVLFYLSFTLILVLWALLSHALDLVAKLPVLSSLNGWSGAALGLLRGAAILFIVCQFLVGGILPRDMVEKTVFLHFFCTVNPLALFP